MNRDERIVLAMIKAPVLEEQMNKLDRYVNTCDPEAVLQMHKTKGSINDALSAELIHIGQAIDINSKTKEMGELFLSRCKCEKW